jgi:hypothetical protein
VINKAHFTCSTCRGPKRVVFEKRPVRLAVCVALGIPVVQGIVWIQDDALRSIARSAAILAALLVAISLIRIKCPSCDSPRKDQ